MTYKKIKTICLGFSSLVLISLLSPCVSFADDSSIVTVSDAVYADLALRHNLNNVSVYWKEVGSSDSVSLNTDRQWVPASTIKTYVAMYAYHLAFLGQLSLYDYVQIQAKNVVPTELETDEFPVLSEGDQVTVSSLIQQMLTQSDNTAYNTLLDLLDRREITKYVQSLGLNNTVVGYKLNLDDAQQSVETQSPGYAENTTTAADYAKAFGMIENNTLSYSKTLFSVLARQKINNMIPALLPKDVVIAHKTGDLDPLYHDGGIVKGKNHEYILVVFSNLGDPAIVSHISNLVYTKNFNLVGSKLSVYTKQVTDSLQNAGQPLDQLVADQRAGKTNVLAAQTAVGIKSPEITAADLGISASDLSLKLSNTGLPSVLIPYDSPFHGIVTFLQTAKERLSVAPSVKAEASLDAVAQKVAEVKDLQKRGKTKEADTLLAGVQNDLESIAKNPSIKDSQSLQTEIQSLSDTRFAIQNDELAKVKLSDRNTFIKSVAQEARRTVDSIVPATPKAAEVTSPSQKPLVGQVVSASKTEVTVRTQGGNIVTIPVPPSVSIRQEKSTSYSNDSSKIQTGTTIAIVGSQNQSNTITPSFILTNVPRELAAPKPVEVIKVNKKNNTVVVSENGTLFQIDLNKQTKIKGKNTDLSIDSIKPGGTIVVNGDPIIPSVIPSVMPSFSPDPSGTSISPSSANASHPSVTETPKTSVSPTQSPGGIFQLFNQKSTGVTPVTSQTPSPSAGSSLKQGAVQQTSSFEKQTTTQSQSSSQTSKTSQTPIKSGQTNQSAQQSQASAGQNKTQQQSQPVQSAPKSSATTQQTTSKQSSQPVPAAPAAIQAKTIQVVEPPKPAAPAPSVNTSSPKPAVQSAPPPAPKAETKQSAPASNPPPPAAAPTLAPAKPDEKKK